MFHTTSILGLALGFGLNSAFLLIETNNEILGISNSEESLGVPDDGTFKSLQEKINNTAEGGTLVLENNYTNTDDLRQRATPRTTRAMTPASISRARILLDKGYTQAEVADSLGVSVSTLNRELG